jgi:hypothetical protein
MTSPPAAIDAWAWVWTPREDRAVLAFRVGVVAAMAPLAIETATRFHPAALRLMPSTRATPTLDTLASAVLAGGLFFLLAHAAWKVTGTVEWGRPAWTPLVLLALQAIAGALVCPGLLVVACLQAPWILQGRALGVFVAATSLGPLLSRLAVTAPSRLLMIAAIWLATALGSVVAGSVRAWREVVLGEGELRAARRLLDGHAGVAAAAVHDERVGRTIAAIAKDLARVRGVSPGEPDDLISGAITLVEGLRGVAADPTATSLADTGRELRHSLTELATSNGIEIQMDIPDTLELSAAGSDAVFECARLALAAAAQTSEHPKAALEVVPMGAGHLVTVSIDLLASEAIGEADLRSVRDRLRAVGGALQAERVGDRCSLRALIPDTPRS